jgi:hypothetical protein
MEYTETMQQCLQHGAVQPALQLGVAVLCRTLGWMAREATVWSCWHSAVLSTAAHWTDLRSLHWHRQSNNRQKKCCRQAARQSATKYLQCLQYQLCCTHGAYVLWHTGCTVEESVCLSGAGGNTAIHMQEGLDACGAGLSVSEELAMLGSHSQLAETQCMIQLYLQQQSCNLLAQHAHHACFWRIPVKQTLHCAACTWLNLSVAQTQCMQQ